MPDPRVLFCGLCGVGRAALPQALCVGAMLSSDVRPGPAPQLPALLPLLQDLQQVMVSGPNLNETSIVSGGYGGTAEGIIPTSTIKGRPGRGADGTGAACRAQCCSSCDGRGGNKRLCHGKEGTACLAALLLPAGLQEPLGKEACCSNCGAWEPGPSAEAQTVVLPGGECWLQARLGRGSCVQAEALSQA